MGTLKASRASKTIRIFAATIAVCVAMYVASTWLAGIVKINTTDSMPLGIYLMQTASIHPGQIVVACPPPVAAGLGLQNGYLERGSCASGSAPLLKYVAAVGGSFVRVTPTGVFIDGKPLQNSSARRKDLRGRLISRIPDGAYRLARNQIWLYSPAPWSWDSRYFGSVSTEMLIGVASPLLVLP